MIPEGKQNVEELFEEIRIENFPNLVKKMDIKPQEAQRVQQARNPKRPTPRHIIIKCQRLNTKRES